jgi:mRNA interferase MazF
MKRGDIVTVSISGEYGKPRPAVVVQTNALTDAYPSIIVCPITSTHTELGFRIAVEPSAENGLQVPSQIMTDKIIGVPRTKIGRKVGRLYDEDMRRLDGALVFLLALSETQASEIGA